MTKKEKGFLIAYVAINMVALLTCIMALVAKYETEKEIAFRNALIVGSFIVLIVPLIFVITYFITYKKSQNSGKRHVFVYAAKSKYLLAKVSVSRTLIEDEDVLAKTDVEAEIDSYYKKRKRLWIIRGMLIDLVIVALTVIGLTLTKFNPTIILLALVILLGKYACTIISYIIANDRDGKNYSRPYFDKDKELAVKKFDELDSHIQIVDYKIYNKEMYIEIPTKEGAIYALIQPNKLFILPFSRLDIKQRDSLNNSLYTDSDRKEFLREYNNMYKRLTIDVHNIKGIDLYEVLQIVRTKVILD